MQTNHRNPIWTRPPLVVPRRNKWNRGRASHRVSLALRPTTRSFLELHAADLLTIARVILAAALVWSAVSDRTADLGRDIWLLVLAWSTDMVDGGLSRMLKTAHRSWLGRNDVYIDMFVSVAVLVYLTATGLLPLAVTVGYLLVWGVLFLLWGIPALFAQFFQNPIYACFVYFTAVAAPHVLPWLLLFAVIAFLLFRRRLFELLRGVMETIKR